VSVSQYVVTAVGLAAIVWVLWYFLLSKGSAKGLTPVEPDTAERRPASSPHKFHE
jgi:plastocyanin domain-containing protein